METNEHSNTTPSPTPTPTPTGTTKPPVVKKPRKPIPLHIIAALAAVALFAVVAAVGYLAKETAPGDTLYDAKINIYERAIATTKFTGAAKIAYDISRTESRLAELQMLANDTATSSPETFERVGSLIESHANDGLSAIENSSLSAEDRILEVARLGTVLRAAATLVDQYPELASSTDAIERVRDSVADSQSAAVENFTTTNATSTIEAFIGTRVDALSARIGSVAPGSAAQRLAITRVTDASEAVADGNLRFALSALLRAEEAIGVDHYLYASERGEAAIPESAIRPTTTEGQ